MSDETTAMRKTGQDLGVPQRVLDAVLPTKTDDRLSKFRDYVNLDKERRALENELKHVKAKLNTAEETLLTFMEQSGMQSAKIDGITVYLHRQWWASATDVQAILDNRDSAFLVKETVNGNSLSSWVRELDKDGEGQPVLPDDLKTAIKVTERFAVRTRKA